MWEPIQNCRPNIFDYGHRRFADWANDLELTPPGPDPEIDEAAIAEKGVQAAMDLLRREEGFIPKTAVEKLKPFDQLVLAAVYMLHGSGHELTINDKVGEMYGRNVLLGSIFGSLSRMQRKGLIECREASRETEAENELIQYYLVTMSGERALAYAKATSQTVADFLGLA